MAEQTEEEPHTVDRLKERFGTVDRIAKAAGLKQNSVSSWRRKSGVPLDAARRIAQSAPDMGVEISFAEILDWIDIDAKRMGARR